MALFRAVLGTSRPNTIVGVFYARAICTTNSDREKVTFILVLTLSFVLIPGHIPNRTKFVKACTIQSLKGIINGNTAMEVKVS